MNTGHLGHSDDPQCPKQAFEKPDGFAEGPGKWTTQHIAAQWLRLEADVAARPRLRPSGEPSSQRRPRRPLEASAPGGLDPLMQRGFSERLCGLCRAGLCRPGTHTAKRRQRTHARAEPRHTARRESHAAALFSVTKRGLDFSAPTRGELKKTC